MKKNIIARIILSAIAVLMCMATDAQTKKEDWAQFYRYADKNKAVTTQPEAVFMGNSITDFWVKNDSAFFHDNNFVGRGISGQTTSEMLVRFRQDVISLHPKKVIILAGTNDIAENNKKISLENILGNIISMAELAQHHGIGVVLCSVLPCDRYSWRPALKPAKEIISLYAMIKEYASKNDFIFVDYHSPLATPEGALNPEYTNDGCHPTLPGYKVMEVVLMQALAGTH